MDRRRLTSALERGAAASFVLMAGGMPLLFAFHALAGRRLGVREYGAFSTAHNNAALLGLLVTLGWPLAAMRFVTEYREHRSWALLRGVLRHSSRAVLVLSAAASGLLYLASLVVVDRPDVSQSLLLTAILLPVISVGELQLRVLRGLRRVNASIVFERVALPALVLLGLFVFSVHDPVRLVVAFAAIAACIRLLAAGYIRRAVPSEAKSLHGEANTRHWYKVAAALALGEVGRATLARAGVTMLGPLAGLHAAGVYSGARRAAMPVTFTLVAVTAIAGPLLAAAYHGNRRDEFLSLLRRASMWAVLGALPAFAAAAFAPRWLLGLFGEGFTGGGPVLFATAVGGMTSAAAGPVTMALVLTGRERQHAAITGIAAVAAVAVSAVAIPRWGAVGAAWSTTAVMACQNIWLHVQARRSAPPG
jgi:O-antigen/teichoic acid export membrane protein